MLAITTATALKGVYLCVMSLSGSPAVIVPPVDTRWLLNGSAAIPEIPAGGRVHRLPPSRAPGDLPGPAGRDRAAAAGAGRRQCERHQRTLRQPAPSTSAV